MSVPLINNDPKETKLVILRSIIALLIIILSVPFSSYVSRKIKKRFLGEKKKKTRDFIYVDLGTTLLKYSIVFIGFMVALKLIYIDTTALFGTLAVFGFGASLALQDSLKDFSAGIFIILFNYFGTGDVVKIGEVLGKIYEFRFFSTTIIKYNNIRVDVPNSKIWNNEFINFSRRKEVNYELLALISNNNDLEKLTNETSSFLKEHELNPNKKQPTITIENTSMGYLRLRCIVPINSKNYEKCHYSLPRELRIMLQKKKFKLNEK